MRIRTFEDEAENCRRQASSFAGRPEEAFLLKLASSFDELAWDNRDKMATAQVARARLGALSPALRSQVRILPGAPV
jgi:hypothetical protein